MTGRCQRKHLVKLCAVSDSAQSELSAVRDSAQSLTFGNYLFSKDYTTLHYTTKVTCYHDFNTICTVHMAHKKTNYFKISFFTLVHFE